ncbi:MAG: hypothetical protein AAFR11_03475 [Pseudomonadota bacterium]
MSNTIEAVDVYATWRGLLQDPRTPIVEDQPACGRYAVQFIKEGPVVPVAIDPDGSGGVVATSPFSDSHDMEQVWPRAAKRPLTSEDFEALWAKAGSNQPPAEDDADDVEALIARVEAASELHDAASEGDLADALHVLKRSADDLAERQKSVEEPLKQQLAAVSDTYKPQIEAAKTARTKALALVARHLQDTGKDGIKGRYGKKISLRVREEKNVVDPGAFLDHMLETNRPAVVEAVAKALKGKAAAGTPGVEVVEKVSAQ